MKNIDDDTLTFLLKHGHFDRQELLKRGLDSSQSLKYSDVVNHLAKVLQTEKWFTRYWQPEAEGEAIYEGVFIERIFPFLFFLLYAASFTLEPYFAGGQNIEDIFPRKISCAFLFEVRLRISKRQY